MVFESLVVSVLNHFLGPYIKNLDASQLKLGIWSGDALLERLEIKENAFTQLNLPVRVKGGFLNRLRLKIPWKSKFTDPVVAEVEGLYLIASPLSATPYDGEKESKEAHEKKQNQLKKIEEAKKREKAGGKESDDGFVAKLVTQIIKNIQITVDNIHIRYEDDITIAGHNFAAGVTLEGLIIQSTDSKWKIGVNTEEGALIYKILQLNSLCVYWDTDTQLFGDLPSSEWLKRLKARITTSTNRPAEISYILKPLSAEAKATLTTKPGQDPNIPQADVSIVVNEVALHVDKLQFRGVVSLAESLDRMSVNARYRKYKPAVKLKNNPKLWWKYAIASVVEEHVKRKTQMWSPTHIKQQWKLFKNYVEKYKQKVLASSPSKQLLSQLEQLEDQLDVGNIIVARNEAELRARKIAKQRAAETKASGGWFSWFTTTVAEENKDETSVIPSDKEMEAERQSLYKAIGYAEGKALKPFAKEYVAHKLKFHLTKVTVELYNDKKQAAMLQVLQVEAAIGHRPSAKGISVTAMVGDIIASGIDGNNQPVIVESTSKSKGSKDAFVDVKFEMNPLDIPAEQSIRLITNVKPLKITYNATTIEHIIQIFKVPKHVHLQQVSSSTTQSLKQLRTQTRTGLQHAIRQRRVYDINIKVESPYVVVPENGLLRSSSSVLLVDLGCLAITSDSKHNLPSEKSVMNATTEELSEAFYDNFDLKLDNVQVIVARQGDDWERARISLQSNLHVLEKVAINLKLKKSLLPNDTRLPALIVEGALPDLCLSLSDKKLEQIIKIALSIPVPPPVVEADPNAVKITGTDLMSETPSSVDVNSLIHQTISMATDDDDDDNESDDDFTTASEGEDEDANSKDTVDGGELQLFPTSTELLLKVELGKIGISFDHWQESSKGVSEDAHVLSLEINAIKAEYRKQTWGDVATVTVAKICILNHLVDGSPSAFLTSEVTESNFISLEYCQAKETGPQFKTYYQSTKQSVTAVLSLLTVNVQAETLPKLLNIFQCTGDNITAILKERKDKVSPQPPATQPIPASGTPIDAPQVQDTSSKSSDGITQLHLVGQFGGFSVAMESSSEGGNLLVASVKGVNADVKINDSTITVKASISDMDIEDPSSSAPYNKIVSKSDQSEYIIDAMIVAYKDPIEGDAIADLEKTNLSVKATVAELQVMVIFQFIKRIIDFVTNLQINRKLLQSAGNVASQQISKAANALRERNTSRVKLNMIVNAPIIVIPASTTNDSADIFVINLGRLEANNKFITGSQYSNKLDTSQVVSSTGQPAIMDKLSVKVTSIYFHKVKSFESIENMSEKKVFIKLLECSAEVTRNLSPWCKVLPLVDVSLLMDTIYVYFTPNLYHSIMTVVESAKILSVPTKGHGDIKDDKIEHTESEDDKVKELADKLSGEDKGSKIIVHTTVTGLSLLVNSDEEKSLAAVKVKGLSVDATMDNTTITVIAKLKAVNISNLSYYSLFPLVLYSGDKVETLFVKAVLHRDSSSRQHVDPEISVTAKVQQINVVILYQFIMAIQDLVDELKISKKPTSQGKQSTKETTSTPVPSTRSNAMKIKFDVNVQAPNILLPFNSLRREGYIVDLGHIGVSNSFQVIPETSSMETKAILDIITIDLSGLTVYRFVMGNMLCKHLSILHPLKTEIVVERNLSSWYKEVPLVDVRLYLHPIKASISDNDLSMALEVLQHNVGEVEMAAKEALEDLIEEEEEVFGEKEETSTSSEVVSTGDSTDTEESRCIVTLRVLMDGIDVQLYHKALPFKIGKIHSWKRNTKMALASVGMNTFKAKLNLHSDKMIELNLSLLSLNVEDSREGNDDRISMMIHNHKVANLSQPADDEESKMVVLNVIKDKWNRLTVKAKFNHLQLLLDVTFIFMLLDFAKRSFMIDKEKSEMKKLSGQPTTPRKEEQQSTDGNTIKVDIVMNEPRIALLEDASKPNSRAIVLQSYIQLIFNTKENSKNLAFIGKDLSIILTRYTTLTQAQSMIMAPCTVDLSLSDSAGETNGYLEITESIKLIISPATVRLLLYVVHSIPKVEDTSDDGQNVPASFWRAKPLDKKKWYFTTADTLFEVQDVIKESSVDAPKHTSPPKKENMVVTLKQLQIVFEKELLDEGRTIPLILFTGEPPDKTRKLADSSVDKEPSVYDHPLYVEISDWSGNMSATAKIQLRGSYFNERLDVIEPLLEPVEKEDFTYRLWELNIKALKMNNVTGFLDKEAKRRSKSSEEQSKLFDDNIIYPSSLPPEWSLDISSEHTLQLTLTKTCLEILMELQKSYLDISLMEASDSSDFTEEPQHAIYTIINKLGADCGVTIVPKGNLKIAKGGTQAEVKNKESIPLMYKDYTKHISIYDGMDCIVQEPDIVEITVKRFAPLKISLTDNRLCYYALSPVVEEQTVVNYGLMVEIDRHKETKRVTLQSPLAICNHLNVSCDVYASELAEPKKSKELVSLGQVKPEESISIPLLTAHKGYVFLKPTEKELFVSSVGIHRRNVDDAHFNLSCQPRAADKEYFYIRVKPVEERSIKASKLTSVEMERRPHHVFHLYYPVLFYNMLPIAIATTTTSKTVKLQAGEHQSYSNIDVTKQQSFTITFDDSGHAWRGSVKVWDKMENDKIIVFNSDDKVDGKSLEQVCSVSSNQDNGYLKVLFYAKYWITNKTDQTLMYSGHELIQIVHPSKDEVKFFSMKKKDSKESEFIIRMTLPEKEYTTWSRVIPLVAAGSAGTFKVQHKDRSYELGIKVQILTFGLSMMITITPLYVLKNDTTHSVVVQEVGQKDTVTLAPKTTMPFWPVNTESCKLTISINDSTHMTKPFSIMSTDTVLLKTEGNVATSAVVMDQQVTELCKIVSFKPLFSGAVPCVLINHFSHLTIVFRQNIEGGGGDEYRLSPGQSMVFTWSDPCKKREIEWWLSSKKEAKNIMKIKTDSGTFKVEDKADVESSVDVTGADEIDDESIDGHKAQPASQDDSRRFSLTTKVKKLAHKTKHSIKAKKRQQTIDEDKGGYWVSFLDGLQRVIIFTPDAYVYKIAQRPSLVERTSISVTLDLLAIGLSLVNDIESKEVAYLGLTGSEIVWEYEKKNNKWVPVSQEDVDKLERFYAKFENGQEKLKFPLIVDKDTGADFDNMTLTIGKKTYKLRRTFYEGFSAQVSLSKSETRLSARIGRIQLDNQLSDPIFDNVFHAVPPVNEIARKHPPKPFFEVSTVIGPTELSGAKQYPYFELLVQKMSFNLDLNFLFSLMDLFTGFILREENSSELKLNEISRNELKLSLENVVLHSRASQSVPNYFGAFKIHPLSIVLSLNFGYTASDQERYWYFGPVFNMLKSFGASFITTDDVNLKLSLFAVENKIMTQQQLVEKIKQHYIQGGIGQAYKILLGLDVLGNPVGFVTGLASGTKGLFYEPFEGALLGPEEFLQGLGYGVHDFFGATIGGVADSISRITDTAGNAAVALILSDEEKRKREASRRGTSMLGGLGHFASDIVGGVTGVVSKPVEGAKKGGITGFLTGTGKGMAGLFLRPIGGTFDLLNVTFDNVKKVTKRGDYEISQLRPSRYIGVDGVVQIYSFHLATGNAAFMELNKYTDTDTYINHVVAKNKPISLLIVTTRRFMMIGKGSLTGGWQVEQSGVEFTEMASGVKVDDKSIVTSLTAGKESGGFQGIAGRIGRGITGSTKPKIKKIELANNKTAQEAAQIINDALNAELEE